MATSETLAFNPSVSQCIQEAYQRCNVQLTSGMSLSTALFSLNILSTARSPSVTGVLSFLTVILTPR